MTRRDILELLLDLERRIAIAALLEQPDPPELQRRGHRVRFDGKPDRYWWVRNLSDVYVQTKLLAFHERRAAADMSTGRHNVVWGA
jgi:hypothetical protein